MTQVAYPSLPYGSDLTRAGVTIQQNDFGIRIIVPPLQSWRQIPKGYFIGFSALMFFLTMQYVSAALTHSIGPELIPPTAMFGGGAFLVVYFALRLLRRRTIIDVTDGNLIITQVTSFGTSRRMAWPRRAISEIKLNPHDGKFLVRSPGIEMAEFYFSPRRQVVQDVADLVHKAVFEGQFTPANEPELLKPLQPSSSKLAESIALFLAAGCFFGGFILVLIGLKAGAALMAIGAIIAIPVAGFIHGTQEKKFYT